MVVPSDLKPSNSLQDGLDRAGSAIRLLWKPNAPSPAVPVVPVVPPEIAGWREEQRAWTEAVALFDLSHHMFDCYIDGPDAVRLLARVSVNDYEGLNALQGTFYSPDIEDYYVSPYELGYGRGIAFNHDFIGRAALERAQDRPLRTKVTLVWNPQDVEQIFDTNELIHSYARNRVEVGPDRVGSSDYAAFFVQYGTVHSLAVIDRRFAAPGTEVTLRWGQHPGPDADASDVPEFDRIRAVVGPAPYHECVRTQYRAN